MLPARRAASPGVSLFLLLGLAVAASAAPSKPAQAPAKGEEAIEARLTAVKGTAYIHLHGKPKGEFIEAEVDAPLFEGDLVRTGTDGRVEITLEGKSLIELSPNSDFVVEDRVPSRAQFHLGIGSLVAKVKALAEGRPVRIRTLSAVAAIRGTDVAISQEEDDQPARVGVFEEGEVAITGTGGVQEEVTLGPGQETEVKADEAPAPARPLDAMERYQERVASVKGRLEEIRARWEKRSQERLLAWRARMEERQAVRAEKLRNVLERRRHRMYEFQKKQEGLRDRIEEKRRRTKERLEKRPRPRGPQGP